MWPEAPDEASKASKMVERFAFAPGWFAGMLHGMGPYGSWASLPGQKPKQVIGHTHRVFPGHIGGYPVKIGFRKLYKKFRYGFDIACE